MSTRIVAIIGRQNVGKSTLFNRILGARGAIVDNVPGVTRDRKYAEAEWAGTRFTIIDTGGYVPASDDVFEKAIREQAEIAIQEADSIIFVLDALTGVTPLDAELANILRKVDKPVHCVVNKVDSERSEVLAQEFYGLGLGDPKRYRLWQDAHWRFSRPPDRPAARRSRGGARVHSSLSMNKGFISLPVRRLLTRTITH